MSDIMLLKFLKMSPNVNYCDENNCNLLHNMIGGSEIPVIKKLLNIAMKKGQLEDIINKKNNNGKTPLHCAIENKRQDVAALLVKHGADTNIMDINGKVSKWVPDMSGGGRKIKITGWRKIE
tara:strand:- start:1092 stop:1457 length:366 start_codon:yes stop_codon:yes gene_type:complete